MSSNGADKGHTSLMDALRRIECKTVAERLGGLGDLRHVLQHNRGNPAFDNFNDKSFHKMFDVLEIAADDECAEYGKSLTSTHMAVRTKGANRFVNFSQTLRLAVECSVRAIKLKTLRLVLRILTKTSVDSHGTCYTPIAVDYARCFSAILGYEPHVEHLGEAEWRPVARFCLDRVSAAVPKDLAGNSPSAKNRSFVNRSRVHSSHPTIGSENMPKQAVDEFISCIRYLTGPPSAPVMKEGESILFTMLQYLDSAQSVGSPQISALTAVNNVLSQIRAEDIQLTISFAQSCLHTARSLWNSKLVAIKNEVLIMLVLLHPHVRQIHKTGGGPTFVTDLEALLDGLKAEYTRRDVKDQLRMDELRLAPTLKTSCEGLSCQLFSLRDGTATATNSPNGEHNWTLLRLLICFSTLETHDEKVRDETSDSGQVGARKRVKLAHWSDELMRSLHDPHVSAKVASLQLICFAVQSVAISEGILERMVERLNSLSNDDNGSIASWALLSLACCATQFIASTEGVSKLWAASWNQAIRLINSASTCRAASYLMHVLTLCGHVGRSTFLDTCTTITSSIEVNGPSSLSDASASFLSFVVIRLQQESLQSSEEAIKKILSWLFKVWAPSNFRDRLFAAQSINTDPLDILDLINTCLGRSTTQKIQKALPIWGPVAQAWVVHDQNSSVLKYLLLIPDIAPFLTRLPPAASSNPSALSASTASIEALVLRLSTTEVNRAIEQFEDERGHRIGRDMVRTISSLAIVAVCLGQCHEIRDTHKADQLQCNTEKLLDILFRDLSSAEQQSFDAFIDLFAHSMVLSTSAKEGEPAREHCCMSKLAGRVSELLTIRASSTQSDAFAQDNESDDGMGQVETKFESQNSIIDRRAESDYPRRLTQSACHPVTQRIGVSVYATLMSHLYPSGDAMDTEESAVKHLTDFLTGLKYPDLLASRPMIAALHDHIRHFSSDDTNRLMNRILDGPLRQYEYERAETLHALVLEIMLHEMGAWTDTSNSELYLDGVDLCAWLTRTALSFSSSVQKTLCKLMLQLIQVDSDYGSKDDLPSIRSTLFNMLKNSKLEVGHYLAECIPSMFNVFTISRHEEVFDDLKSNLTTDVEWTEGIAIRLLTLARLAAKWSSLLRPCIYGIFDTAGQVAPSTDYATHCISHTSQSLGLQSSQDLFKLFAPQLFYTWFDVHRELKNVPFQIFGYSSLPELLQHNLDEIYAQLVIRDNTEEIKWLVGSLRMAEDKIMRATYAKSFAYTISWDIAFEKSSQPKSELHLRSSISDSQSVTQTNFPYIIANMYLTLDQDESVDKALEKRPKYKYAGDALRSMRSYGSSDKVLPPTQQPYFKGKYLLDQMERTTRRVLGSQREAEIIALQLTPSTLTIVLRCLLDAMHPALGSLHACQIVRKIRLLISFAGENAVQGYPLEMLLRTLRPLAVDPHCADDIMGMFRYLLEQGTPYLKQNISTLASVALLLLLSMKSFMVSRVDRTTQESQFRNTVSKMQNFHDWLVEYLCGFQDAVDKKADSPRKATFSKLVLACRDLSLPASADKVNPASSMLQALMDDEQSLAPILGRLERKQVISLLCRRFEIPNSTSQDIFGSDIASTSYAKCVWSTTQSLSGADEYEAWAARVLGRAFAASVTPEVVRSTGRLQPGFLDSPVEYLHSTQAIAAKLNSLLLSDERATASIAERALRKIFADFTSATDSTPGIDFENLLPPQVVEAMVQAYVDDRSTNSLGRSSLLTKSRKDEFVRIAGVEKDVLLEPWVRKLSIGICNWVDNDSVISSLGSLLEVVEDSAQQLFPFIVHLALQAEYEKEQTIRVILSKSFTEHFETVETTEHKSRLMLETVLYLLTQPIPQEDTLPDRLQWLDIEYVLAAKAAAYCGMPTAALYLIELSTPSQSVQTPSGRSRRSTINASPAQLPSNKLLLEIYKSVDDPDSFYGVQQAPSLQSVMDRVDHEKDGLKGIMLHSARMDASLRRTGQAQESDSRGTLKSMGAMNLNSLTHDLLSQKRGKDYDAATTETMLESARKLQQWDIAPPNGLASDSAMLYGICKGMATTSNLEAFKVELSNSMRIAHRKLQDPQLGALSIRTTLSSLAVLAELDELTTVRSVADLKQLWDLMQSRQQSWDIGRYKDAQRIISYRETMFGILSQNEHLREALHVNIKDSRTIEVEAIVKQSEFARRNDMIQHSLAAATYLSELVPTCAKAGVKMDAVAQFEAASILWRQGEISSSVQMLQELRGRSDLDQQAVKVGSAGLLAQLGHEIAVARLEKPDEIIAQYLKPAISQLGSNSQGSEAGRVFYEFASFCDQQLQNTGLVEDFQRLERLSQRRAGEVHQLQQMLKSATQKDAKNRLKHAEIRAKQWYSLDNEEYEKAKNSRDEFVRQSLENYLRALQACDDFNSCVVRFFALWLEYSDSPSANQAVLDHLHQVPSWKFVGLTNQLTSRLQDDGSTFQRILKELVIRMCIDHPYHMVHNIYAGAVSAIGQGDESGLLRKKAANGIKGYIRSHKGVGRIISVIWQSCHEYVTLAQIKISPPSKNQKLTLANVKAIGSSATSISRLNVPPATLHLALRPNADYQNVPTLVRFRSEIKIAGGLSAPKILIALGSDGKEYRQLFKGGNDDLRQDAIMEQVFAEVSKMLQNHKATRQRSIRIRTYKVIPLTPNAGIIEFVPNSMPLAEFINPAHVKYHPHDMKIDEVRKKIGEAARMSKDQRLKVYQDAISKFQPVLRHFFFERFNDPDEWFERRLAYTRSTAAISILGYVLGLGDRHTQNILLDEKSGEVIHIDLGVAFEAGRVLPIPEVVPFRLTRDIVDGMGISKTEGVFRRSCEFTLEALREETDGIMTLLSVLRYDPLYSWTLSPLRAKRLQGGQDDTEDGLEMASKKGDDEAGEADRALSVVEKKLSKTLSVAATVNELIQTATDERNLAVLFSGWAAYA